MNGELGNAVVSTLALSVAAGALLMVLAKRMKVPGIVLLLFGGVIMGPELLGWVRPATLGPTLNVLVAVAVGLILFEGGLTLNVSGYRSAPRVIRNLLTIGVLVTWTSVSGLIWLLFRVEPEFAVLAGSLVIVTGPTVIQPILKRIRLKWNLHNILHWEGVLIDPIGVFLAILAYEWVVGGGGEAAFLNLLIRIFGGLCIGFAGGELIAWILKRHLVPDDLINVFVIGSAMLIFGATEALIAEGGLLSVTVAGLICGSRQPPALKEIVEFKSVITDLLIGFIFILLTARLKLEQFTDFGWTGLLLVALVVLLVRPLAILLSTRGTQIRPRELLFLSWVAPRGVVAASMASLFALTLSQQGSFTNPAFLESFVYSVIFATVLLQGPTAGPLARALGLLEKHPDGWLIVGAHPVAREVAHFLERVRKVPVALIDGNRMAVTEAREEGLQAFYGDARETARIEDRGEMQGVGKLLAFTDNEDLNELLCKKWEPLFGKEHVYRWASAPSRDEDVNSTGIVLWSWMPKPSMISSEILLEEAAIIEIEGERMENPGGLAALLTAHSGEVLLDPGPKSRLKSGKGNPRTLYLQREADFLLNVLDPGRLLQFESQGMDEVYKALAHSLAEAYPSVSGEALAEMILEREKTAPTTLGHGVALPHVKVPGVHRSACAVGLLREGLRLVDGEEPIRLVFMLVSAEGEPEMHLAVLGEIARLCAHEEVRRQLMACEDPGELLPVIRRYRRQHTPFADARG
ncbi:MAG: cation:proton antiporter [Oceanipulchritudo sp.]